MIFSFFYFSELLLFVFFSFFFFVVISLNFFFRKFYLSYIYINYYYFRSINIGISWVNTTVINKFEHKVFFLIHHHRHQHSTFSKSFVQMKFKKILVCIYMRNLKKKSYKSYSNSNSNSKAKSEMFTNNLSCLNWKLLSWNLRFLFFVRMLVCFLVVVILV